MTDTAAAGAGSPSPVDSLQFRWPWRPYQERVLRTIDLHLADQKLHVVAAPGAGKTVLGIEVFRRLAAPTLVLSPTRGIRDQWITRLRDFVPEGTDWPPPWVSCRLDDPRYFTSVTYQALHTRYREEAGAEDDADETPEGAAEDAEGLAPAPSEQEVRTFAARLQKAGVRTLILDEAHHLRAEWWEALIRVLEELPKAKLVALTATPPYDVTGPEWKRYQALCGPVDEEISIPELVKAGTLCPHQDYVWLVEPTEADREAVCSYRRAVEEACRNLLADDVLRRSVQEHPWVTQRDPDPAAILDAPELAFAILIFLKGMQAPLPGRLLKLLDTDAADLPEPSRRWWQVLIRAYLFDTAWPHTAATTVHRDRLARDLRKQGLLWQRELRFLESRPVRRRLSLSPAKIPACVAIYRLESEFRGASLRQVILTDYIHDQDLESPGGGAALGAWPVFRALVTAARPVEAAYMGLLTGRLAVIPERLMDPLRSRCGGQEVSAQPVGSLPGFMRVTASEGVLLKAYTDLLSDGTLRVLVGTRSLLGEGWDAPALNSLILASFVGSFMLTNQMRGRALRIDRKSPDKSSSVWHLVAVVPKEEAGLTDVEDLQRRFQTFVGLDATGDTIESGLDRMRLGFVRNGKIHGREMDLPSHNAGMSDRLRQSGALRDRWAAALQGAEEGRVLPSVRTELPPSFRPFILMRTLRHLLWQVCCTFTAVFGQTADSMGNARIRDMRTLLIFLSIAGVLGSLAALPKFIKVLILFFRHLPVDGAVRQIALAVRDALCAAQLIENDPHYLGVRSDQRDDGSFVVSLTGAEFYEQALFADCLDEVLGPVENPRYLITRRSLSRWIGRVDFHAVPERFGLNKERAQLFHQAWQRRLGPSELIYTRSAESRRTLLRARARSFAGAAATASERVDRWV